MKELMALDPAAVRCPYPYFAKMRADSPVTWIDELGCFAVVRYQDILEVVRDTERFSSRMPTGPKAAADTFAVLQQLVSDGGASIEALAAGMGMASVSVLLSADPPSHDEQRKLVSRAFTPRRVRDLEPRIREIAEDLVEGFVARGHCEFISEFAVGLPLRVIAESLGVPPEDMAMFKRWSDDLTAVIGNHQMSADQLRRMLSAFVEFFAYFTERIVERRAAPSEDLISAIVYSAAEGERPLSDPEMLAMFAQFLVAGNETTTKLLGSLLLLLLEQPELLAALRADSSKIPQLVEETLRLESPVQGLFRVANVDTEVGGVSVRAGSSLWVIYASGNRDAEEFTCPDVADLERANSRSHLAFGNGVHYCLGAALARAEARIGLEVILERLDDLALDGEADLLYERSYVLHGLRQLPITFRRR